MNTSYRLVLKSGPATGQTFSLEGPELIIGREPSCQISINDPEVSRRHARLYLQGVNYVLEDLGSTNGTSVNGQRLVGPYILRSGEMVTLGENTHLLFEQVVVDPDATVVSVRQAVQPVNREAYPPAQPVSAHLEQPNQTPVNDVMYAGQMPAETPKDVKKRKITPVVIILIVLVVILLCGCIAFGIFDALNLYCNFPGITNFFIPGACAP
jgi:pSer/pThr/pTyr-binding forkhead associated (FHA) protein